MTIPAIVTDSTASIPEKLLQDLKINTVPFSGKPFMNGCPLPSNYLKQPALGQVIILSYTRN
jgi:hypothetical protein